MGNQTLQGTVFFFNTSPPYHTHKCIITTSDIYICINFINLRFAANFYLLELNIFFSRDEKFEAVLKYNPNATLKTIDGTTHLLMFEKPDEFLETVREFLS